MSEPGFYPAIDFTGGGLGALDKLDGSVLYDKDLAAVITLSSFAPYSLDADSGAGESSPQIIAPNTNPGNKRWILTGGIFAGVTSYDNVTISKNIPALILSDDQGGGTTWNFYSGSPAAGDFKLRGQSTDVLKITGSVSANSLVIDDGKVGIKDASPNSQLDVTGDINTTVNYKVDDVQVVSNRVIDARIDDAINSGDATTDGVIDAMRDAMITHGLIAAA